MGYNPICWQHISDKRLKEVFEHANMYLADVYTMLDAAPPDGSGGGRCNFAAALVLCSIFDGLSIDVYPTVGIEDDAEKRFKKLALKYLADLWGPPKHGWIALSEVGGTLYLEVRNPLAHNVARDIETGARRDGYGEPYIVRSVRGGHKPTADELESMPTWNLQWPVLWAEVPEGKTAKSLKLSVPALYWYVKKLVMRLASDASVHAHAIAHRK